MFTGIVEEVGHVTRVERGTGVTRLSVEGRLVATDTGVGDSIAINGTCLTVVRREGSELTFEAVAETLTRTNLGELQPGSAVNLERALAATGRLAGHIVQGHVDGVGTIQAIVPEQDSWRMTVEVPPPLRRYLVEKGSVAMDGISLTVASLTEEGFTVAIIPHTWQATTLHARRPGDRVNLETDVLAKYVEKLIWSSADRKMPSR
jgi:riboflavin synthase